jgi:hypothetical protein
MTCAAGPFEVLTKINDNAYVLYLPAEFGDSTNFNVSDLKPYTGEDQQLEGDEDTTSISTPAAASQDAQAPSPEAQVPHQDVPLRQASPVGPITRARARELNYVLLLKNESPRCIEDGPTGRPRRGS